jgi:hypothetical protein
MLLKIEFVGCRISPIPTIVEFEGMWSNEKGEIFNLALSKSPYLLI